MAHCIKNYKKVGIHMIAMINCSPLRSRPHARFVRCCFAGAFYPITVLMYMVRQGLIGAVLSLSKAMDKNTSKSASLAKISPSEVYGPLPAWQMADIQSTADKGGRFFNSNGHKKKGFVPNWLKSIVAVCVLVFAVACDDFVRFEAERFICDPSNGLGLQEAELIGKSNEGKMRLTFADGNVQEVKSTVTEKHYMVKTTDFRAKIDRKTGKVSGKRGVYSTSFDCNVHAFRM